MRCDSVSPTETRNGTEKVSVESIQVSSLALAPLASVSTPLLTVMAPPAATWLVHLRLSSAAVAKPSRHFFWMLVTLSRSSTGS